ncbi:MAG: DUF2339 domain-containing protein, partial [Pseudomonadota bacterium]
LVFGAPIVVFAIQAALLRDTEYGLAVSSVVAALFYAVGASSLYRRKGPQVRLLVECYLALAVAFAVIAVPLAFDGRWTSAAWALQGAALAWIGIRQSRKLATLASTGLILFSGLVFVFEPWHSGEGLPLLNSSVLGGLLISLSALFVARRLDLPDGQALGRGFSVAAAILFGWGVLWWFGTAFNEIDAWLTNGDAELHVSLLAGATSMVLALWLSQRMAWSRLFLVTLLLLPAIAYLALDEAQLNVHYLFALGWLAWPAVWLVQGAVLHRVDQDRPALAPVWHVLSALLLAAMVALEAYWRLNDALSSAWGWLGAAVVLGLAVQLIGQLGARTLWPVRAHPEHYRSTMDFLVLSLVVGAAWLALERPGDPTPLTYLPLINPFDGVMVLAGFLAIQGLRRYPAGQRPDTLLFGVVDTRFVGLLLAGGFLLITSAAVVRAVHHLAGVPWAFNALFDSVVVQSALAIYWGLLGFIGMIWGAKNGSRQLWVVGAGFMALVVLKLFLVDLGGTGTIARIISFIGIGALLTVVGYFAPAPPSARKTG